MLTILIYERVFYTLFITQQFSRYGWQTYRESWRTGISSCCGGKRKTSVGDIKEENGCRRLWFHQVFSTPSISLIIDIPDNITDGSFYSGKVFVGLKENAFEPSSPIRHVTELNGVLNLFDDKQPILLVGSNCLNQLILGKWPWLLVCCENTTIS